MGNLNKVLLIGRICNDIEKRITPQGKSVVNFSLATNEFFKDSSGNKQERTEFHRLVAWERTADILEQYCQKGSQIYVEGSLQTREWKDKDGNKRYTTEIMIRSIQMLDSRQNQSAQQNTSSQAPPQNDFIDDDIPF